MHSAMSEPSDPIRTDARRAAVAVEPSPATHAILAQLKFMSDLIFHNFSWKSMIFHVFSMKINDFWWFFDENSLEKFDTPVCKLKFSRQIWFLLFFYQNQWFFIVFLWKSMIFDDFSLVFHENQWFLMLFWWKSKIFDAFSTLPHSRARVRRLRGASGSSTLRTT